LGIHLTPDIAGGLRIGPNSFETDEIDYSVNESHAGEFLTSAKTFLPDLKTHHLTADISGIRAKLKTGPKDTPDFIIKHEADKGLKGLVNLIAMESPGLTSSLAIAQYVENLIRELL
jgi:L-2-hydroxyglutarate oxidase LhgO